MSKITQSQPLKQRVLKGMAPTLDQLRGEFTYKYSVQKELTRELLDLATRIRELEATNVQRRSN